MCKTSAAKQLPTKTALLLTRGTGRQTETKDDVSNVLPVLALITSSWHDALPHSTRFADKLWKIAAVMVLLGRGVATVRTGLSVATSHTVSPSSAAVRIYVLSLDQSKLVIGRLCTVGA